MKVLVLSQYWHPENGVPQRRWEWLTKILIEAGHEVVVVAPPPHYKRKVSIRHWFEERGYRTSFRRTIGPNGETVLRSGFFPSGRSMTRKIFNQAWTALTMTGGIIRKQGMLRSYQPDLVIGTVPALPTAAVTYLAARCFNVPYVIDLRDAWPSLFRESAEWNTGTGKPSLRERIFSKGPFQLLVFITERTLEFVLGRASGIVTTSGRLTQTLMNELSSPITTVRNVFPPAMKTASLNQSLAGTPGRHLNVLYAGTLGRAQKLENALRAAAIAEKENVHIELKFIGEGATWDNLRDVAQTLGVHLELEHQKSLEELDYYYQWADTALVHLTDWESLRSAIPSKTYELMENKIHISGVVQGEPATLIQELEAGDVIPPNDPEALARLWVKLAQDRSLLDMGDRAQLWVRDQREEVAPHCFLKLLEQIAGSNED